MRVTCGPAALPGEACGPLAMPSGSSRRACAVRLMPRARLSLTPTRIVRLCLSSRRACAGQAEPKVEEKKGFSFPSFGDKKAAAPKAKKAAPKAKKAAPKAKKAAPKAKKGKSLLSFLPGYEDENGNDENGNDHRDRHCEDDDRAECVNTENNDSTKFA